jgi:hypothetical protein
MWFVNIIYPFLNNLLYFNKLFYYKLNCYYLNNTFLNYFLNTFHLNITFVNFRKLYFYFFSIILDIIINFLNILPVVLKITFKYRNKKYLEICLIQFKITKSTNKLIKFNFLNEFYLFLIPGFLKKNNLILKNKLKNLFFFNLFFNIKYLKYYRLKNNTNDLNFDFININCLILFKILKFFNLIKIFHNIKKQIFLFYKQFKNVL